MPVSLHECSSKAENRELSQNKAKQGQKSIEKKHKDNIQYLSTLPISAGKSARSRSSLDHAEILKGGFDLSKTETEQKWLWMQKWPWMQVLFDANQQSKNIQTDFRAPRRCRSSAPRSTQSCYNLTLICKKCLRSLLVQEIASHKRH